MNCSLSTGVTAKTLVMGTKAMSNGAYVDYCYMEDLADGLYQASAVMNCSLSTVKDTPSSTKPPGTLNEK